MLALNPNLRVPEAMMASPSTPPWSSNTIVQRSSSSAVRILEHCPERSGQSDCSPSIILVRRSLPLFKLFAFPMWTDVLKMVILNRYSGDVEIAVEAAVVAVNLHFEGDRQLSIVAPKVKAAYVARNKTKNAGKINCDEDLVDDVLSLRRRIEMLL